MTRQELINLLRVAESALQDAMRVSPTALAAHTQVARGLRALADAGRCSQCGTALSLASVGRPKTYCGSTCRSAAYRARAAG